MNYFRKNKKVRCMFLVILITMLSFGSNVFARTNSLEKIDADIIQGSGTNNNLIKIVYHDKRGKAINPSEDSKMATTYTTLPSSYDARNDNGVNYVTRVKDQGGFGTCWTFGANSALEAAAIRSGLGNRNSVDISEAFLTYFGYNSYISDKNNLSYGDGFSRRNKSKILMSSAADFGGNPSIVIAAYASGCGITDESDYGYNIVANRDPIAESNRYNTGYRLLEGKRIFYYYPDNMTRAERFSYINSIKTALLEYKVLDCGAYYPDGERFYKYNDTKNIWAQYQNVAKGSNGYYYSNHEVSIIGYDDNFSRDNFRTKPPANGAWLIKNSWGTDITGSGYTWISYYDESVTEITAYDIGPKSAYDNCYQYDGGLVTTIWNMDTISIDLSNIYTSKEAEVLNRVGFYTYDDGTEYDIKVYKNLTSSKDPSSGTLIQGASGVCDFSGYHTIKLDNEVPLNKGDTFSVVVTLSMPDDETLFFYAEDIYQTQYYLDTPLYNNSYAKRGQSFINYDGSWIDVKDMYFNNIPIKAFTKKATKITDFSFNNPDDVITVNVYESKKIGYKCTPSNARCDLTFKSNNSSIARVTANGKVIGVKAGETTVLAKASDGEKEFVNEYRVIVKPAKIKPVSDIFLYNSGMTLSPKKSSILEWYIYPENATYNITATSSNKNVATVMIRGKSNKLNTIKANENKADNTSEIKIPKIVDEDNEINIENQDKQDDAIQFFLNEKQIKLKEGESLKLNYYSNIADFDDMTYKSLDEDIAVVDKDGVVSGVKEGEASIALTVKHNGKEYTDECNVIVNKEDDIINTSYVKQGEIALFKGSNLELIVDEKINKDMIEYKSLDEEIVSVDESGRIEGLAVGETFVEIKCNDEENSFTELVKVCVVEEDTEFILPDIDLNLNILSDVDLNENNQNEVKLDKKDVTLNAKSASKPTSCTIKAINLGNSTITVQANDGIRVYKGRCYVKVRPARGKIRKITAGRRKATVKISKVSGGSWYEIQRSTKRYSGFKTVRKTRKTTFVNRKLKRGKTYYFRVRAYKTYKGVKYYGTYSKVKKVKVK